MLIENAATYYSSLYFQSLMLLKNHPHTVPNFFLHQFINKWTYLLYCIPKFQKFMGQDIWCQFTIFKIFFIEIHSLNIFNSVPPPPVPVPQDITFWWKISSHLSGPGEWKFYLKGKAIFQTYFSLLKIGLTKFFPHWQLIRKKRFFRYTLLGNVLLTLFLSFVAKFSTISLYLTKLLRLIELCNSVISLIQRNPTKLF